MRQQLNPGRRRRPATGPTGQPGRRADGDEAGTGLFASVFGLLFIVGFLLLASEVLLTLHRASVVRAAALDGAHAAAEAADGAARACTSAAGNAAAARVAEVLGPEARVSVQCRGDEAVAVTVAGPRPRLAGFLGPATISRSAEVRFETRVVAP